ncbi:MAG: response regulator, partial [Chromatiales bacterium]|nr:response regulator [Chromatiales bacterium]
TSVAAGVLAVDCLKEAQAEEPFDLVLMDWHMPDMDGIETIRQIQQEIDAALLPKIVMVTAFGREEIRAEAEKLDVHTFLLKPVNASMMIDAISMLFSEGDNLKVLRNERHRMLSDTPDMSGTHILLVEDNLINQEVAFGLLSSAGITVATANNGVEAVEMVQRSGPTGFDLILMDLQMPEMDGFEATQVIRGLAGFEGLPIIGLTAHALAEERENCLNAGMNDHVTKPIDPATLFASITQQLGTTHRSVEAAKPDSGANVAHSDKDTVASILDVDDGVARVGGDRTLYMMVIQKFAEIERDSVTFISDALEQGNRIEAQRRAHSTKGSAANIGAMTLHQAAAHLEVIIRDDADAELDDALAAYDSAIQQLQIKIEAEVLSK